MPTPSVTLLRTQSDERLVALARAGQERAFEAIVERYRKPLLRHCRRVLPEARAEDALQQALVSAWTALQRGDDVHDLRPWLYRIVHNTSLNALRVNGYDYDELRETLEGIGGPAELAERRALVRHTFAGLADLPERQREALLAIAVEGRSQEEVADELGLTSGAVRQLVHRARTTLRAAATAVTPLPLVHWLGGRRARQRAGREPRGRARRRRRDRRRGRDARQGRRRRGDRRQRGERARSWWTSCATAGAGSRGRGGRDAHRRAKARAAPGRRQARAHRVVPASCPRRRRPRLGAVRQRATTAARAAGAGEGAAATTRAARTTAARGAAGAGDAAATTSRPAARAGPAGRAARA